MRASVIASIVLAAAGVSAHAATIHNFTFTDVESIGGLGDPENISVTYEVGAGFSMGKLSWYGIADPQADGTTGNQLSVTVEAPDGTTSSFRLGEGGAYDAGAIFSDANFDFVGADPVGTWTFTFYEGGDDAGGPDAVWEVIHFSFTDQQDPQPAPDVSFCQLYGLAQYGDLGDVKGLALATTSWNLGDADLPWFDSPDSEHPMIAMNAYRLDANGRFQQIGQSWCKHGFFALSNTQCGGTCTFEPGHPDNGTWLGMGCTDTYGAFLNSLQNGLGPRFEINPWTGDWSFQGSMFQQGGPPNTGIARRLQVHDDDMNTDLPQNKGAQYFAEGYYVHFTDSDVINSTAWKPFTPNRNSQGDYTFSMTNSGNFPNIGFAIDAWGNAGAELTMLAQELPVDELNSPDGRCILGVTATDNGDGTWHYEYAVLNIDMDRQVGSFTLDVPGVDITNAGFYAVPHHDEPLNSIGGVPIDNAPWDLTEGSGQVSWSTSTNPLRWGTIYNFWFDADAPPADGAVTLGLFKPGTPNAVTGSVSVPVAPPSCVGDVTGDDLVDSQDLNVLLGNFGMSVAPNTNGDLNGDGIVDSIDLNALLAVFGSAC